MNKIRFYAISGRTQLLIPYTGWSMNDATRSLKYTCEKCRKKYIWVSFTSKIQTDPLHSRYNTRHGIPSWKRPVSAWFKGFLRWLSWYWLPVLRECAAYERLRRRFTTNKFLGKLFTHTFVRMCFVINSNYKNFLVLRKKHLDLYDTQHRFWWPSTTDILLIFCIRYWSMFQLCAVASRHFFVWFSFFAACLKVGLRRSWITLYIPSLVTLITLV